MCKPTKEDIYYEMVIFLKGIFCLKRSGLKEICRLLVLLLHTGTFTKFSSNKVLFSTFTHVNVLTFVLGSFLILFEVHNLSILSK